MDEIQVFKIILTLHRPETMPLTDLRLGSIRFFANATNVEKCEVS